MPTKSADDPVAIWGHILCQQLSLPVLNWRKAQRENYPIYREIVTPSVFAHSNPAAFQNILHFLFNTLDPVESAEKFVGLWPLHPGDKKAESQFRSAAFRWLAALQKGEWTPNSTGKKTLTKRDEEVASEVRRLGPVLLAGRLNVSQFVSPVGEGPTALLAKFAHLVGSVMAIRKHGSSKLDFTPVVAERPRSKKNVRVKLRNAIAAKKADKDLDVLHEAASNFENDAESLHQGGQLASRVYADLRDDIVSLNEQVSAVTNYDEAANNIDQVVVECLPDVQIMRSFNHEILSKPELAKLASDSEFQLDLCRDTIATLNKGNLTLPEMTRLEAKLKAGIPVEIDDVLAICENAWRMFCGHIEKQTFDRKELAEIRSSADQSREVSSAVNPTLEDMKENARSSFNFMTEFIRKSDSQRHQSKAKARESLPTLAASSISGLDGAAGRASEDRPRVPTVDEISTRVSRRFRFSRPDRLQALTTIYRASVNEVSTADSSGNDESQRFKRQDESSDVPTIDDTTASKNAISERLAKLKLQRSTPADDRHNGTALETTDSMLENHSKDKHLEKDVKEEEEEEEEEKENNHLATSHLTDSVFSPLVQSRSSHSVFSPLASHVNSSRHLKATDSSVVHSIFDGDSSFGDIRDSSSSRHHALAALSDSDLGINDASVSASFASASATSFVSATVHSFTSASGGDVSAALPASPCKGIGIDASQILPFNGLPSTRRWSSLGAGDDDIGIAELSLLKLSDSDASFL